MIKALVSICLNLVNALLTSEIKNLDFFALCTAFVKSSFIDLANFWFFLLLLLMILLLLILLDDRVLAS